jgi:hemoglobin
MEQTPLFERLGGRDGIHALVEKVLDNHFANPTVCTRFEHAKMTRNEMVEGGFEFFCTGLSGIPTYTGRSIPDAHAGMNISDAEFNAVLDDILGAMTSLGIGELEQAEALRILYGLRTEVVGR